MRSLSLIILLACALGTPALAGPEDESAPGAKTAESILGTWHLLTTFRGDGRFSKLVITKGEADALVGAYTDSNGDTHTLKDVTFEKGALSFKRDLSGGPGGSREIGFKATVEGATLTGNHLLGGRKIPVQGARDLKSLKAGGVPFFL